MGVDFAGRPFPETLILADVELAASTDNAGEGTMWLHPDGMIGMVPLPGGVWRIFGELRPDDPIAKAGHAAATALTDPSPVSDAVLDRVRTLLEERIGDAAPQVLRATWTSVFRFHRRIASAYRRQRLFLAGDAAHIHSALGGQGMNIGIGDAFNLGWKLASVIRGSASDRLLDTYQAERRPVASEVVRKTSRDWNILIGHTVLNRLLRDHVLLPLLRLPAMQRRWLEAGSQLRVSYRGGPLAEITIAERLSSLFRDAPLAGDRAPSAACRLTPSGEATTLGRLTGAGWALLLFGRSARDRRASAAAARAYLNGVRVILVLPAESDGNPAEPFEADAVVHDNDGAVARAYRPGRRSAILLRPDGHIALRASRRAPERLAAWLHRSLGTDNVRYPTERPAINQNAFFAGFGAHSRQ